MGMVSVSTRKPWHPSFQTLKSHDFSYHYRYAIVRPNGSANRFSCASNLSNVA